MNCTDLETLRELKTLDIAPTGSFYICSPAVTSTDRDYAILVSDLDEFGYTLEKDGWAVTWDDPEYTIEENGEIQFITARKDVMNLIIFSDSRGYFPFVKATRIAKHLNLLEKDDRVMLFQAVCGGRNTDFSACALEDFS